MRLLLGIQSVREALRAHGSKVTRVLIELQPSPTLQALARFAADQGATVEPVPRATLDALSAGTRHQGAAAYAPPLVMHRLEEVLTGPSPLIIALDEVQDPQNFGAVIRSAVAIAGAAVMWPEHASAPLTPTTFRASAGAIEHATLVKVGSLRSALGACAGAGAVVVALDGNADTSIFEVDLTGPAVLVVGSEGKGLRKGVRQVATVVAKLPMTGVLDSLNASAATSIALYEAARQRAMKTKI
jgi:23S rRNA (guanosine2251-2'-O)-methyltransferase